MTATARPWRVEKDSWTDPIIIGADGKRIAGLYWRKPLDPASCEDDANLIVEAVTHFDDCPASELEEALIDARAQRDALQDRVAELLNWRTGAIAALKEGLEAQVDGACTSEFVRLALNCFPDIPTEGKEKAALTDGYDSTEV